MCTARRTASSCRTTRRRRAAWAGISRSRDSPRATWSSTTPSVRPTPTWASTSGTIASSTRPNPAPPCASRTCARPTGPGATTARAACWSRKSAGLKLEDHRHVDGELPPARRGLRLQGLLHHGERLIVEDLVAARVLHHRALDRAVRVDHDADFDAAFPPSVDRLARIALEALRCVDQREPVGVEQRRVDHL